MTTVIDPDDCARAVEEAFLAHGRGGATPPALASVHASDGAFHVKAGILDRGRSYFVSKTNANFPGNRRRHGLPTIQGTITLCDATTGSPLAIMDSTEVTALRTAAATAVAVRWLARTDAATLALIGCGIQGRAHVRALRGVRRFERLLVCDKDVAAAHAFAAHARETLGVPVRIEVDPTRAALAADVCVTCTPSREFLLDHSALRPGMFIAGVGVDHEEKRELAPSLLAEATIVVDVINQCAVIGDLHHAIEAGVVSTELVHAELGEIVAGQKPGRGDDDEVIVFDSTGMALQDAAAAALVFERAVEQGTGLTLDLAS